MSNAWVLIDRIRHGHLVHLVRLHHEVICSNVVAVFVDALLPRIICHQCHLAPSSIKRHGHKLRYPYDAFEELLYPD